MKNSIQYLLLSAIMMTVCSVTEVVAGKPVAQNKASAIALFNGKDLTGWKAEGGARWEVKQGILTGRQGPNNEPGDLFTEKSFGNFELSVTYKIVWPANSGIWYRYQSPKQAYQADILEYKKPFALSGTLYCPGKLFLATNTDASTVNREGWNKMVIRAVGDHHTIFLNDKKVAAVQEGSFKTGRIGFQIHAGDQFGKMRILIKQVSLREISE